MARCSCGGGTCNCVVQAGSGIRVSGAGSSGSPYVIDSTGEFGGSIITVNSDTLQLSSSGQGTQADPIQITGQVTMDMTDLLDVSDPQGGPQEGEVPVWTTDHWEFKIPAAAPPGSVNVGAGILGDGSSGNPLQAAISGIWGSGSMAGFPADTTLGVPTYIDALGQVRARPVPVVRHAEAPISPAAGWTLMPLGNFWAQHGSMVYLSGYLRRTGATIPSTSNGNIFDESMGTLPAQIPAPFQNTGLTPWGGTLYTAALTSSRQFVLGGLPPNIPLTGGAAGMTLSFSMTYIANTGVVL